MSFNGDIAQRLWEWKGLASRKGRVGGWKVTHPDLTTRDGFQWPAKGKVTAPGPFTKGDPCPSAPGDGLCVAVTFSGASSGGIPAITGLLIEYADALGSDESKVRVPECWVVGLVDVPRAIREGVFTYANLIGANLTGADLARANLTGADLTGADLARANLARANLIGADLTGADLTGANLARANLARANLARANLARANLVGANLTGANLARANLVGANLARANPIGADLTGAVADKWTWWPAGFDPVGVIVR